MALGTMTKTKSISALGPAFIDEVTLVGDGAYATGGTTGLLAKLRALTLDLRQAYVIISQDHGGGYSLYYDWENDKLKCFYANNDGGADGPLIEVANAADLSGVTFRFWILSV